MSKPSRDAGPSSVPVRRIGVALAIGIAVAGCAPDALTNRDATGFNAYLQTVATSCRPLMIGSNDVGEWLRYPNSSDPNYLYFLDMTSRLYYGTVQRDAYRDGITGFLGPGTSNATSFACIFRNLPAVQTGAPRG
jgi:hypothetical protein